MTAAVLRRVALGAVLAAAASCAERGVPRSGDPSTRGRNGTAAAASRAEKGITEMVTPSTGGTQGMGGAGNMGISHVMPAPRGDDTARLPDHAALWARIPLPFTPAEAWRLLSPETQAEIGAAVIGMVLADYVSGDMHGEADHFHDDALRGECMTVRDEILGALDDRLWTLFPDLYGPDGDHPRWALDSGMAR